MKKPKLIQNSHTKKGPRVMMIYSKNISRFKNVGRKNNMFHIIQIFLTSTESRRLCHQYGITQSCTIILFLDIIILAMALAIKKMIVEKI
jgi:hypothetical protein